MKAELSLCRILRSYLLYCYFQWTRGHMPQKRKSVEQSRVPLSTEGKLFLWKDYRILWRNVR